MPQSKSSKSWNLRVFISLTVSGAIAVFGNRTLAQIMPDTTLGSEQSVINSDVNNGLPRELIRGGAIRGRNLFHSFQEFNVNEAQSVYFQNPAGIENIISRVIGGSPSNIRGTLGVSGGTANLFLLNPSGIIFGPNARLDIGGSFVATTANAIQFGDQGFFSSSDLNSPSLLTVNPSAFFFNQTAHGSIVNRSTVPSAASVQGLQVADGRSLLLLGGNVNLEGGAMSAFGGRVELGGVAGAGTVGLSVDGNELRLSFPKDMARADVSLTSGARVDVSGEQGGSAQIWGRDVLLRGGSQIASFTQGAKPGGNLTVDASESVELTGLSKNGILTTQSFGAGRAGDITINTRSLSVRAGAQVLSLTFGEGSTGQLRVNASESVELIGSTENGLNSGLFNSTIGNGDVGNLIINTGRLIIRDKGGITTQSVSTSSLGQGGNLIINASDSVEITDGFISALSQGTGRAGNISINVRDTIQANKGDISTRSVQSSGGAIDITAGAIRLQDNIDITAFVSSGTGGGGNITLNALSIVALDDSDILAFSRDGRGGNITLNTPVFIGFRYAPAPPSTDPKTLNGNGRVDINASGALSSGTITLPNVNPSQGLVALPTNAIDASELITNSCIGRSNRREDKFIITGRGGLPPNPRQVLRSQAVQVDWVTLDAPANNPTGDVQSQGRQRRVSGEPALQIDNNVNTRSPEIVEAQGWVVDANGKITLVATAPTAMPHSPWFTPPSCPVR
jgi:filamentous hemagglutinin family protein